MISAKVIKDSVSPEGVRLTTMSLTYPRLIHSEIMTHRVFSRNASSSRAVPVSKVIHNVLMNPAQPVEWGSNKPGMQAGESLTGWRLALTIAAWQGVRLAAVAGAWVAMKAGAHKQIANRLLEPWSHISVLVSATEWDNFFGLRLHKDADPTMQALARAMFWARGTSNPSKVRAGEWHLPYITAEDAGQDLETLKKMSAARCARVSYLTHEGKRPSLEADLTLFDRLMGGEIVHASPTEHQATPDAGWHGNFQGWWQFRKEIPNEVIK